MSGPTAHGRFLAPTIVGRDAVFERLDWAFSAATQSECVVQLAGDAGLGKTRLASILEGSPDPRLVQAVATTSRGNPFAVEELARHEVAAGRLDPVTGVWSVGAPLDLPWTVTELVLEGVRRLPELDQEILRWAAVIGPPSFRPRRARGTGRAAVAPPRPERGQRPHAGTAGPATACSRSSRLLGESCTTTTRRGRTSRSSRSSPGRSGCAAI